MAARRGTRLAATRVSASTPGAAYAGGRLATWGQRAGAGVLVLVAAMTLYLATVVLLVLALAAPSARIIGATTLFIMAAIGAPVLVGNRLRQRGWTWSGVIVVAALICIGICLCIAPVAFAAMAM